MKEDRMWLSEINIYELPDSTMVVVCGGEWGTCWGCLAGDVLYLYLPLSCFLSLSLSLSAFILYLFFMQFQVTTIYIPFVSSIYLGIEYGESRKDREKW